MNKPYQFASAPVGTPTVTQMVSLANPQMVSQAQLAHPQMFSSAQLANQQVSGVMTIHLGV